MRVVCSSSALAKLGVEPCGSPLAGVPGPARAALASPGRRGRAPHPGLPSGGVRRRPMAACARPQPTWRGRRSIGGRIHGLGGPAARRASSRLGSAAGDAAAAGLRPLPCRSGAPRRPVRTRGPCRIRGTSLGGGRAAALRLTPSAADPTRFLPSRTALPGLRRRCLRDQTVSLDLVVGDHRAVGLVRGARRVVHEMGTLLVAVRTARCRSRRPRRCARRPAAWRSRPGSSGAPPSSACLPCAPRGPRSGSPHRSR